MGTKGHNGRIRVRPQPWHEPAYRRWKEGATVAALAKFYRVDRSTMQNAIDRGREREEAEIRERKRQVKGEPLVPLPPFEKKMEACRLFAAGQIDIGELAKRLRGQR